MQVNLRGRYCGWRGHRVRYDVGCNHHGCSCGEVQIKPADDPATLYYGRLCECGHRERDHYAYAVGEAETELRLCQIYGLPGQCQCRGFVPVCS